MLKFLDALRRFGPIPDDQAASLTARVRVRRWKKREWLVRPGERCDWVGFLESGLVRHVHHDRRSEIDLGFDFDGRFVTAFESFATGEPSRVGIQALAPTRVHVLRRAALEQLCTRHGCWDRVLRRLLEAELLRKTRKEIDLAPRLADERHERMVARRQYRLRLVPARHLASYLGVAPETLSRIRARAQAGPRRS